MSTHRLRLPKPGGQWRPDPSRDGLAHRDGNPWDRVRPPHKRHRCVAQSRLVWAIDTTPGNHVAALRWCACGAVCYPGTDGRWLGKNVRRRYYGAVLPAWHRAMADLDNGPATVFARPRGPAQLTGTRPTRQRLDLPPVTEPFTPSHTTTADPQAAAEPAQRRRAA